MATLPGFAYDGRHVHVYLVGVHTPLTSGSIVKDVLEKHYIPWMCSVRETVTKDDKATMVSIQDSDPEQYQLIEDMYPLFDDLKIRIGFWSASQTGVEQDEDVQSNYREYKKQLPSNEAQRHLDENPEMLEKLKATLRALECKMAKRLVGVIATTLIRSQYAHSECFRFARTMAGRRKTGHNPMDIDK